MVVSQKQLFWNEKPPEATAKNTRRTSQNVHGESTETYGLSLNNPKIAMDYSWSIHRFLRGCIFVTCIGWLFGILWWSLGVFGVTWGSSDGNQRLFSKGCRMIFWTFVLPCVSRSGIHPGGHLEPFLNTFEYSEAPWCDKGGLRSHHRCDV